MALSGAIRSYLAEKLLELKQKNNGLKTKEEAVREWSVNIEIISIK